MTAKSKFKQEKIVMAFAIAMLADIVQFPITAATATGILAIPGELADIALDFVVMCLLSVVLDFHWVFLPTLFVEVIPGLDLVPTWTAAVAFVVWQRNKAVAQPPPMRTVVDVNQADIINAPSIARFAVQPPPLPARAASVIDIPAPTESPVETRLKHLNDLRGKGLLSPAEYETKRSQILSDL